MRRPKRCHLGWRHCRYCRFSKFKLHPQDAREIRRVYGKLPSKDIAGLFGVSPQHVANIGAGRRWANV